MALLYIPAEGAAPPDVLSARVDKCVAESLATELLVGRRKIDWPWWRGGCGLTQGLSVLSVYFRL